MRKTCIDGAARATVDDRAAREHRPTFFGETVPGIFKGRDLHFGRKPTPLSLQRYDCVPPGGGRFDLPDHLLPRCWRDKPTGTTDVMGRMRWDAPSLTIRTEFFKPEKGQYLHPQWDANGPSAGQPVDHARRGRAPAGLPRRLPVVRHQDRDRQADRQRGPVRPRCRDRRHVREHL